MAALIAPQVQENPSTMVQAQPKPSVSTPNWMEAVKADLQRVETKMRDSAVMGQQTLDGAVEMIIASGGKRMRPSITILVGRIFDAALSKVLSVAASIELLHTATLVHDDLIDGADERRGAPTLHSQLSTGVTVLTGDFLFAQAASLAAEADSLRVVQLFSQTLVRICRGEILQAQTRWQVPDMETYESRIYGKTASLFEAAATSGAILAGVSEERINAMAKFGREFGMAFQIVDDALDFLSTTQQLGKPTGHDMSQGNFNLPVMYYVDAGYSTQDELTERLNVDTLDSDDFARLVTHIQDTGMVQQSLDRARDYINSAVDTLRATSSGVHTETLNSLTDYVLARTF